MSSCHLKCHLLAETIRRREATALTRGQTLMSQKQMVMSRVQARAEEMIFRHGFLGVPVETFEQAGRSQLIALLNEGLNPESKALDIGCGCLRVASWLIRLLDPGCYYGIEPARQRVAYGL